MIFRFPPLAQPRQRINNDVSVLRFNLYDPLLPNSKNDNIYIHGGLQHNILVRGLAWCVAVRNSARLSVDK